MCDYNRWGGKWNHLSMTPRLATNYAKNYCNRTPIVKVIVENVVTWFLGHSVGKIMQFLCIVSIVTSRLHHSFDVIWDTQFVFFQLLNFITDMFPLLSSLLWFCFLWSSRCARYFCLAPAADNCSCLLATSTLTRKLCYRKDDRAMRAI